MGAGQAIEWQHLALLAGILGALSAPLAWIWRDNRAGIRFAHRRIDDLAKELAEYKLEAAKTYVTAEAITRIENRFTTTENRIADSLEGMGKRIDRLFDGGAGRAA